VQQLRARDHVSVTVQPSGTVTLVFTDIEGSTRLLEELGQDAYREALGEHRRVVREAFARADGYEVDYEGDAFFYAFASAQTAVDAVEKAMCGLKGGPIQIRVGIHTGKPGLDPPKYVGRDVHLAARVMSAGHGGQVVLSAATRELVEVETTDLGEHRLKDFADRVSIFQLGSESFPPLKTISNTNLPRPASSFVGREREVGEVVSLIREGARLVTLTGPGGTGKTRFAIEAAAGLVGEFKAGVFWVGLASLRDPALVVETIAQTLGAKDELAAYIGERELLLLLDNLEQVIVAAPELAQLVEACPNLRLLVTSRELLRVRGEVEYQVLPLAEPDAVELFSSRAQVEPSEAVEELCRRLDNMPLALELAASRARVLSPEQILERLGQRLDLLKGGRDADPRQATLRATIEWSYGLLTPEEQQLFARLGVFDGGCALEAAEDVIDADVDTLQSLVEKSLVRRTGERFWMLETIREFAVERLTEEPADRTESERRHTDFFYVLAREAEVGERGAKQSDWWNRLETELDNLRAVLDRARSARDAAFELEVATLLKRFWVARGHVREGATRLEEALGRASGVTGITRARALVALTICAGHGGVEAARLLELNQEALDLFAAAGDRGGVVRATMDCGTAFARNGDLETARALYERTRSLAREVGEQRYELFAMGNLADTALVEADYPRAIELGEEALAAARESEDPAFHHALMNNLGWALAGSGEHDRARALAFQTLERSIASGDNWVAVYAVELLAVTDARPETADRAALLAGLAGRIREEVGNVREAGEDQLFRPAIEKLEALLGEERYRRALAEGAALTLPDALALSSGDGAD
jgi:predicted ATPase/class 3 adenylate cyclase